MKRKIKKTICTLLAVVLLAAMFIVPAGAVTGTGVDVLFCKPANWSGNIKIHLWNAGPYNTNWPGVAMTDEGNGWYRYKNSNLTSCSIVINDGSGSQTADLQINGKATVKDNRVLERTQRYIPVHFERPDDWGTDIRVYYYSDDANEVEMCAWPGVPMKSYYTDEYEYDIKEIENARIIFTDGVHQYPAQNEPGIRAKGGENVRFYGKASAAYQLEIEESRFESMEAPETVRVNEEFDITVNFKKVPGIWDRFSADVGFRLIGYNKINDYTYVFTVKFTEPGNKKVGMCYSVGYGGDNRKHQRDGGISVDINVI